MNEKLFKNHLEKICILPQLFFIKNGVHMSSFKGSTVLITGGANGIGKIMARKALERGVQRLILWDINEQLLIDTLGEFQKFASEVVGTVIDVSDPLQIQQRAHDVIDAYGGIDILFNNAGVVTGKLFAEHSFSDITKTISINISAPMLITNAFLPAMIKKGKGHIVTISSAAGMLANPKMAVYAGSKWAVLGWAESVRIELEQYYSGKDLHVTTITPSYINTGMFAGVKAPILVPILKPEDICEKIIRAVEKNKIFVRAPFMVKFIPLLKGLLPTRVFDLIAGKMLHVYDSMEKFTGRTK
jgi:all-trans-retinol dehydrogenase (NAD+)